MFFSVVIPTYNRLPILQKCLDALERQVLSVDTAIVGYEVVVVDDGSTDGTIDWIRAEGDRLSHVKLYEQAHQGPSAARNLGVENAIGDTIIFIDSDLVVTDRFLQSHADALVRGERESGNNKLFTYGAVINTANFDNPTAEPYKITDFSNAYFATGNVAIAKQWLLEAGLFDIEFQLYGWEDLELGVRLKNLGLKLIKCPDAVGYHWHPAFSIEDIPNLIDKEIQRGRMGVLFYQKHPSFNVKMMIQMTWIHRLLWGLLSLGGAINEKTMAPLLKWSIAQNKPQLAEQFARIFLNWYNVQAVYAAYRETIK